MKETFRQYQVFTDETEALEISQWLDNQGIPFEVKIYGSSVDSNILGAGSRDEYILKLRPGDFGKVNEKMEEEAAQEFGKLSKDHFLFGYSDDELVDILQEPDQWHPKIYFFAVFLLQKRGHSISREDLEIFKRERSEQIMTSIHAHPVVLVIGYLSALFLIGGGFIVGMILLFSSKNTLEGNRFHTYSEKSRKHGRNMVFLSLIPILIALGVTISR